MEDEIIDPATIEMLLSLDGGEGTALNEFISIFNRDVPPLIEQLTVAARAGNAEALWKTAHMIRSYASNLGTHEMLRVCDELQHLGLARSTEGGIELSRELEREYIRASGILGSLSRSARKVTGS